MLEREFLYLATPYTDDDPKVRENRFIEVNKAAAHLLNIGFLVYSPISHSHKIAEQEILPSKWEFWRRLDEAHIRHSNMLVVLMLEGYKESVGVNAEIEIAKKYSIPILYMDPATMRLDWSNYNG